MIGLGVVVGVSRVRGLWRAIQAMFSQGEKGVWYDPSDMQTLFQDSAGTTPVTAVGQPVGLMLDKSQGLVLGPELVTNGTFNSDTAWNKSAGATIANGVLTLTTVGASDASADQQISTVNGKRYALTVTKVSSTTTGTGAQSSAVIVVGNGGGSYDLGARPSGTYTFYPAPTFTGVTTFSLTVYNDTPTTTVFDNISVRELPGYHATQPTSTARPILGRHPISGRRNLLNATDVLATQSYTTAAVAYTLSFTGTGTVALSGAYVGSLVGTGASNRVSLTFTSTAASLTLTVTGSVTLAQLDLGSAATAYQKVVSTYDVTEAGVNDAYHLKFDGVDDFMVTPSINFSATDKMSVFVGTYMNQQASSEILCDFGNGGNTIATGATVYASYQNPNINFVAGITSTGPVYSQASFGTDSANGKKVLSIGMDFSGASASSELNARVNGAVSAINLPAMNDGNPVGNFGNYPLYLGMRGGATLPFNGHLYSLIVRGALSDAAQSSAAETYVNHKTGAWA